MYCIQNPKIIFESCVGLSVHILYIGYMNTFTSSINTYEFCQYKLVTMHQHNCLWQIHKSSLSTFQQRGFVDYCWRKLKWNYCERIDSKFTFAPNWILVYIVFFVCIAFLIYFNTLVFSWWKHQLHLKQTRW